MTMRSPAPWSEKRCGWTIFLTVLLLRALYAWAIHGTDFAAGLGHDNARYDHQSTGILQGDFDLEAPLFIIAPLYPFLQAGFKLLFGGQWALALEIMQVLLCAASAVPLFRIASLLFDRRVAWLAAAGYAVFPPTFLWTATLSQDMLFQVLLIFSVHAILRTAHAPTRSRTLGAAALFALTFLTKAHILLFAPFIALYLWMNLPMPAGRRLGQVVLFATTCLFFTLPFGIYNLQRHGIYTLSSTGGGGHFLTGHNDDVYRFIVDPPPLGSPEHTRILKMEYHVLVGLRDTVKTMPHKDKQRLFLARGLAWCRDNPGKLVRLTAYDMMYFLLPGVNPHHYSRSSWLAMFALSLPLYLLAYPGVVIALRRNFKVHSWILWLFVGMLLFSCVFYVQNRFRTITLEPFYIVYASFALLRLLRWKWGDRHAWLQPSVSGGPW